MKARPNKLRRRRPIWMSFQGAAKIGARVIPPLSDVKLVRSSPEHQASEEELGRIYRIGYYSHQDGLDCVWLVDDQGNYASTTNQAAIVSSFEVVHLSDEKDVYGVHREAIKPRDPRLPQEAAAL